MVFFQNIKNRINSIGFKNTLKLILKNKIYRRMDRLFMALGKGLWKKSPLKDTIILESHNDFDCNGGAFYDYLIANGYNQRHKIIWLIKNKKPKKLPQNVKCFNIFRPSLRKTYHICTAKLLSCDDVITEKVRPDQRSFYLTHGAFGLKDARGKIILPNSIDYVLSTSEKLDPYTSEQMSIRTAELLHLGFPCHDLLLSPPTGELKKITDKAYSKVILWMPTFRKGWDGKRSDTDQAQVFDIPAIDTMEQYESLNRCLAAHDILLVIKLHPMQNIAHLQIGDRSHIAVLTRDSVKEKGIDNYRLMREADAFISDYSAAIYDYMLLDRPVAFVFSDLNSYRLGVAVPEFESFEFFVPGQILNDSNALISFMEAVAKGTDPYKAQRQQLRRVLFSHGDTQNCQRLATFMGL